MDYDYRQAIEDDIREYLQDHEGRSYDDLRDDLFTEDSVTGNASGSYWCNAYKAKECVLGDPNAEDYIRELISEYGMDAETIAEHFMDWEYWDVSIRCYLLDGILGEVLDELQEEV